MNAVSSERTKRRPGCDCFRRGRGGARLAGPTPADGLTHRSLRRKPSDSSVSEPASPPPRSIARSIGLSHGPSRLSFVLAARRPAWVACHWRLIRCPLTLPSSAWSFHCTPPHSTDFRRLIAKQPAHIRTAWLPTRTNAGLGSLCSRPRSESRPEPLSIRISASPGLQLSPPSILGYSSRHPPI